jgi:hypothetical protein
MKKLLGSLLATILMVGVTAVPLPASASVDTAALVPTPAPGSSSFLHSVSCLTATSCIGVGETSDGTSARSLIESWDGAAWTVVASPSVANSETRLRGVSCVDSSFCFAVGESRSLVDGEHTLTEVWDGASWTIVQSPDGTLSSRLSSVSCVSVSFCVAVGFSATQTATLVEIWDGSAWSISSITSPETYNELDSVACVSATFCMAVGNASSGTSEVIATEWNGVSWNPVAIPNSGPGSFGQSISCRSADFCAFTGVRISPSSGIAGFWDGSTWTLDPSFAVDSAYGLSLDAIDCASEQSCIVTGARYLASGPQEPVLVSWDGSSWSEIAVPAESVTDYSELYAVSCATQWSCMSVGYYEPVGLDVTLAITLTGTEPPPSTTTTTPPTTATTTGTDPVAPAFAG